MIGMSNSVLFLICFTLCNCLAVPDKRRCDAEGVRTTVQSSVYQCINGTLVSVGCATISGEFLNDGKTVKTDSYYYQCQKVGESGEMKLVAIACFKNGLMVGPGQTHAEKSIWYTCKMNSENNVVLETSGCVGPEGEKVPVDETLTKGVYVFKCVLNASESGLIPFGCLYNEKPFKFGDAVHVGQFWYSCEKVGSDGVQLLLKGCLDETSPLLPGDIFHSHGFIFKCEKTDTGLKRVGVGCLEVTARRNIIEHQFGDKWVEGNIKMKYVVQCTQDGNGVAKAPVQCFFQSSDNSTNTVEGTAVNPGCMVRSGSFLWQCKKTDKGGLRSLATENATPEDEASATLAGYKFC